MDGQVGEMAALADEELAEPPTRETGIGVETGEAALGNGGDERLQELGRLGAGTGENGVDEAKDRREGTGLCSSRSQPPASRQTGQAASV